VHAFHVVSPAFILYSKGPRDSASITPTRSATCGEEHLGITIMAIRGFQRRACCCCIVDAADVVVFDEIVGRDD
jgi:hypothetical protein